MIETVAFLFSSYPCVARQQCSNFPTSGSAAPREKRSVDTVVHNPKASEAPRVAGGVIMHWVMSSKHDAPPHPAKRCDTFRWNGLH